MKAQRGSEIVDMTELTTETRRTQRTRKKEIRRCNLRVPDGKLQLANCGKPLVDLCFLRALRASVVI
jgi:hypothetical protein